MVKFCNFNKMIINFKYLIKWLTLLVIPIIMYSCGTSSNSLFEKRKHLKGWHFKMKNVPTKTTKTESNTVDLERKYESNAMAFNVESQLLPNDLNVIHNIENQKTERYKLYQQNIIHNQKSDVSKKFSPQLIDSVLSKSVEKDKQEEIHPFKDHFIKKNIKKVEEPLPPFILSQGEIVARAVIYFLILLSAGGILQFIVSAFVFQSMLVSFAIHLIGTYLLFVFFSYFLSKLFRREDSGEVWSLKKTFLVVGIIYFSLVALIITIIALTL